MDLFLFIASFLQLILQARSCSESYDMKTLPGCEKDFKPTTDPFKTSTVTNGNECLVLCWYNNKCKGISICPHSDDPGRFSCSLFGTATDGTCGYLKSAAGCRYLEWSVPRCVPPRIFDEERDKCVCDPVWMYGPNCDQYYKDCTEAFSDGLTVPGDYLVMDIKPDASSLPFQVQCLLKWDGYTTLQYRSTHCPDDLDGLLWEKFRDGFGDLSCAFFLGLEKMYQILQNGVFQLIVYLVFEDGFGTAIYQGFTLSDESTKYTVDWASYIAHGTYPAEDGFIYGGLGSHAMKGSRFSTLDNDKVECAEKQGTGWWYGEDCALVNLNLPFNEAPRSNGSASWPVDGTLQYVQKFRTSVKRTG